MKAKVRWIEGLSFVGRTETNHSVPMDTSPEHGGMNSAATPMEMVLLALGGCTGMDVISILEKKKIKLDDYWVELEAERAGTPPRTFSSVRVRHVFVGKDIPEWAVKRAVDLSAEKYCSVGAMLRRSASIEHEVRIRGS